MEQSFYEEIHRAQNDAPYVDTEMTDIQYHAHYHQEIEIVFLLDGLVQLTVDGKNLTLRGGVTKPFCPPLKLNTMTLLNVFTSW